MGRIKGLLLCMISICMLLVGCAPDLDDNQGGGEGDSIS